MYLNNKIKIVVGICLLWAQCLFFSSCTDKKEKKEKSGVIEISDSLIKSLTIGTSRTCQPIKFAIQER